MLSQNLTEKVEQHSDTTYSAVKGLGYDETNKKLGLVISQGGADTVIPFSGGKVGAATFHTNSTSITSFNLAINLDGSAVGTLNDCDFLTALTVSGGQIYATFAYDGTFYTTSSGGAQYPTSATAGTPVKAEAASAFSYHAIVFIQN